jgi:anti-sigma factor RsiW
MKTQINAVLAVCLWVAGVSAASAAAPGLPSVSADMSATPHDALTLTRTQQKVVWADLSTQATTQAAGFNPAVGMVVPNSITLRAMTKEATSDVPVLTPYDFAFIRGKVLIVNPHDRKITEMITG